MYVRWAQTDESAAGKVPTWESVRKKAAWALKSSRKAAADDDAAVQRPRLLHVRMVSNWITLPAVLSVDVQTQSLEVRVAVTPPGVFCRARRLLLPLLGFGPRSSHIFWACRPPQPLTCGPSFNPMNPVNPVNLTLPLPLT